MSLPRMNEKERGVLRQRAENAAYLHCKPLTCEPSDMIRAFDMIDEQQRLLSWALSRIEKLEDGQQSEATAELVTAVNEVIG